MSQDKHTFACLAVAGDFYSQFSHSWQAPWAMAAELNALKVYWAHSLTGMHDLAMRQIIDGADALGSITSGPTKVEVSGCCTFATTDKVASSCTVQACSYHINLNLVLLQGL